MTVFVIIAIWLCCGLLAAVIAHFKKLSLRSWIIVGLLLGPFAVTFVLSEDSSSSGDWRGTGNSGRGGSGGGGSACGGGSGCGGGGCGGGGN